MTNFYAINKIIKINILFQIIFVILKIIKEKMVVRKLLLKKIYFCTLLLL